MSKPNILIVEDDNLVMELNAMILQNIGYAVCAKTGSGTDAVLLAKEKKPDLVLMDIALEGEIDGIEAAHRILLYHDVPIIYLSSHSTADVLQRAKHIESYGYLLKPVNGRQLEIAIEIALHNHSIESERKKTIQEMTSTLSKTKQLQGMIPVCASCKKIRDEKGLWVRFEVYIRDHSDADFSHGLCSLCASRFYPDIDMIKEAWVEGQEVKGRFFP